MALLKELGKLEEDEALVYLALADGLQAADKEDEACQVLEEGRACLEDTPSGVRDPVLRERFLSEVPAHKELRTRTQA
jgi:hypothetical protein